MTLRNLKSIIGKKKAPHAILQQLITDTMNSSVWIEDQDGVVLLGEKLETHKASIPLLDGTNILGFVKGAEGTEVIAELMQMFISKEIEKKTLGNEVLSLYREINLIYNFSEKLSTAITGPDIANIALEEAVSMINASSGVVQLLNGKEEMLDSFGEDDYMGLVTKINASWIKRDNGGIRADIINEVKSDPLLVGDHGIQSMLFAPLKIKETNLGYIALMSNAALEYTAGDLKLLNTLALMSASAIETSLLHEKNLEEVRHRESVLQNMNAVTSKFVPSQFIQSLGRKQIIDVRLGDKAKREVTVFFSDIRDYTAISEKMSLEENFDFVNEYNGMMGPIIQDNKGFINQYLGDGIMALFPEHPDDALVASVEMHKRIIAHNANGLEGKSRISVGMGLHSGPLIMGITGDGKRLDATIISDTVNTASRMEGLCKYYGSKIIISEDTYLKLSDPSSISIRALGKVLVKGKEEAIEIYDVFEADDKQIRALKEKTQSMFSQALEYYQSKRFEDATSFFAQVLFHHPEDKAAQRYLNNSIQYQVSGVHDNWSGVEEMAIK